MLLINIYYLSYDIPVYNETEKAREQLLTLLRKDRRSAKFTKKAPTRWQPENVIDPRTNRPNRLHPYFTRNSCWEYIEELLDSGHKIEIMNMRKPPGSKGYVMKVQQGRENPELYIKLQIGRDRVIGRSFHD